jgi:hypothetical protein
VYASRATSHRSTTFTRNRCCAGDSDSFREINDIGNLRYVGATDNNRKRAELPADYFSRLKSQHVDVARHLLVDEFALNPEKMTFDVPTFTLFRESRREEIRRTLKRVVDLDPPIPI